MLHTRRHGDDLDKEASFTREGMDMITTRKPSFGPYA
jgi:hypothetical protein